MGRGKKRALEEADEPQTCAAEDEKADNAGSGTEDGLTEMERDRAALIARNRERLLALGIPSLAREFGLAPEGGGKKQKKAAGGGHGQGAAAERAKHKAAGRGVKKEKVEQPTRRSRRLQEAEEHPKLEVETAEERFERELGLFVVDGECPRCGRELERGHRAHLQACTGAKPARERGPSRREDALQGLTEEERQDKHKVLLARMQQLHLDGLIELTSEAAKFVVLGSKGNHYTVALQDAKHTCQCLDHRFRRHNCKHICLVLSQLGIEETPSKWRTAVEARMDELLEQKRHRQAVEAQAQPVPRSKREEVAMKLL